MRRNDGSPAEGVGGEMSLLAVRMSSLGDIVLTFPALAPSALESPAARLVVVTKAAYAPLLRAHPAVDEVVALAGARGRAGLSELIQLARALRARRFAGAYDLHANLRSRLLLWLAGIPVRGRVETRALARRTRVLAATSAASSISPRRPPPARRCRARRSPSCAP